MKAGEAAGWGGGRSSQRREKCVFKHEISRDVDDLHA